MKLKYLFSTVLILFITNAYLFSQTAEEIIKKHIEAKGGKENWDAVKSMKITGKFTSFSKRADFLAIKSKPSNYYSKFKMNNFDVTEGKNEKTSWIIDEWDSKGVPRRLNKAEENVMIQKADFATPFFDYKEKKSKVEYKGKEDVDGIETFVLELTRSNNKVETWYLNTETYLEVKRVSEWTDFGWPGQAETYFDDFRNVGKLKIPFYSEKTFSTRHRELEIEKIELNIKVDNNLFNMPRKKEIQNLDFLTGNWIVDVSVLTRRGTWYPVDKTTSTIKFADANRVKEEIYYDRITPFFRVSNFVFDNNSKKYRLSVYDDYNGTVNLYQGELKDTLLIFDDINILSSDSTENDNSNTQYQIYRTKDKGFIMEIKYSQDKGKTWKNRDKFIYSRKKE